MKTQIISQNEDYEIIQPFRDRNGRLIEVGKVIQYGDEKRRKHVVVIELVSKITLDRKCNPPIAKGLRFVKAMRIDDYRKGFPAYNVYHFRIYRIDRVEII